MITKDNSGIVNPTTIINDAYDRAQEEMDLIADGQGSIIDRPSSLTDPKYLVKISKVITVISIIITIITLITIITIIIAIMTILIIITIIIGSKEEP